MLADQIYEVLQDKDYTLSEINSLIKGDKVSDTYKRKRLVVNVCNAILFACDREWYMTVDAICTIHSILVSDIGDSYRGYLTSLKLTQSQEFIDGIYEAQKGENTEERASKLRDYLIKYKPFDEYNELLARTIYVVQHSGAYR